MLGMHPQPRSQGCWVSLAVLPPSDHFASLNPTYRFICFNTTPDCHCEEGGFCPTWQSSRWPDDCFGPYARYTLRVKNGPRNDNLALCKKSSAFANAPKEVRWQTHPTFYSIAAETTHAGASTAFYHSPSDHPKKS
jgi:hypothetical protein